MDNVQTMTLYNEYTYEELLAKLKSSPYSSVYDDEDVLVAPRYDSVLMPSDVIDSMIMMINQLASMSKYLFGRYCPLEGCDILIKTGATAGTLKKGKFLYNGMVHTLSEDMDFEIPKSTGDYKLVIKYRIVSGVEEERLRNQFWESATFGEIGSDRVIVSAIAIAEGTSGDKDFSLSSGVVVGAVETSTSDAGKTYSLSKTTKTIQSVLR